MSRSLSDLLAGLAAAIGNIILGRIVVVLVVAVPVLAVGFLLAGGTDALVALGLSRSLAGTLVTTVVVIGCVVGLGAFAKYGIDWS